MGELGFSAYHRNWAELSLNMDVKVRPYDPLADGTSVYMSTLNLQVSQSPKTASAMRPLGAHTLPYKVSFFSRSVVATDYYDTSDMGKVFLQVRSYDKLPNPTKRPPPSH